MKISKKKWKLLKKRVTALERKVQEQSQELTMIATFLQMEKQKMEKHLTKSSIPQKKW